MPESLSEEEFASELEELFHGDLADQILGEVRTSSFSDAGLLTMDTGVVVRLADGAEFQLTVKRSR